MPALAIPAALLDAVRAHARAGAPEEVCGVLVGRREGEDLVVDHVAPTRNAHACPRVAYLVPPEELLRIALDAEDARGVEVVGFYHSHPTGPPALSREDHARASWAGAAYLLVWGAPEEGVGCWTWDEDARRFEARAIRVT